MMSSPQLLSSSSLSLPAAPYIYDVIPITSSDNLAAISSNDALRIFNTSLQVLPSNGAFGHVHDGVTCLENFGASVGCLVTTGRDAVCNVWDPRAGSQSVQMYKGPNAPYLALASAGDKLAVGTDLSNSQVSIVLWDSRSPKTPIVQFVESHNDDVTELRFHPLNSSWLLSGSTDGLVNIFDTAITDEDEALLQITNHGSSIHHAGFLSPTEFYALSHDETFSVYQVDAAGDKANVPPTNFGDLRTRLDCDYVVNITNTGDGNAILAAGSHSKQRLDLIPLRLSSGWSFDHEHSTHLLGAHKDEIVRSVCFDNAKQIIFTGGEDGQVKAWSLPADDAAVTDAQVSKEPKGSKKRKKQEDLESEKSRFKPY